MDDRFGRSAALDEIALKAANKADIGVGIHEYLYIEEAAEVWFSEDKDTFDNDDGFGVDEAGLRCAAVSAEVINREVNGLEVLEGENMLNEERGIEGIWVVKVDLSALIFRKAAQVFVVGIVGEVGDLVSTDAFDDNIGDSGFTRTGAASNANDNRSRRHKIIILKGGRIKKG